MEYLRNILLRNPDAESIDLEFQEISSIDQLAPLLGQMNKLKELLLHGNRLQHLPENLTLLYQLETLDISNNMITNIQNVLPGLASLPKLKDLTINIKSQKDESLLKQHLPQLEYLNGKPFKSIVIKKSEEITLKQKDLETVAILYDNIRELFQEVDPSLDENLANQFDMHIKTVMFDLSSKLKPNLPEYEVNSQIAEAKFSLYSICFKQFEEYLKSLHPKISSVMSGLHDSYDNIYADMASISNNYKLKIEALQKQINSTQQEQQYSPQKNNSPSKVHVELEVVYQENMRLQNEIQELRNEMSSLQEENKIYLEQIIKHSKGDKSAFKSQYISDKMNANSSISRDHSFKQSDNPYRQNENLLKQSFLPEKSSFLQPASSQHQFTSVINSSSTLLQTNQPKLLTQKQLTETINEIYASKIKSDKRAIKNNLPKETMEQHMYTHLNQKFGLKNIIIEQATNIINGIKKYSQDDNDVKVFGKILRNECDEEFRFVQNQVKQTLQELLKMHLRGKHPLKKNAEINVMLNAKINDYIYDEECEDIVRYMYNQDDAHKIIEKLNSQYIHSQKSQYQDRILTRQEKKQAVTDLEKPKVMYNKFEQIILEFQLLCHEIFLQNFNRGFKLVDQDNNGIINEEEFFNLINLFKLNISQQQVESYLTKMDPYSQNHFTFSQVVLLFSQELINDGTKTTILQSISQQNN